MKTKSIAMVLIILMSICLAACEDERNVPAYGTGLEENVSTYVRHNLSPTAPVETEPVAPVEAYIYNAFTGYSDEIGEYVAVTVVVTNNTGETQETVALTGVNVVDSLGRDLVPCMFNVIDTEYDDLFKEIPMGEQEFGIHVFASASLDFTLNGIEFIDISLQSGYVDGVLDTRRFYLTEE